MSKHSPEDTMNAIQLKSRRNLLTGCLEWFGFCNKKGYGTIRWNQKMEMVHRVVWEYQNGPIPKGSHVLHACDNPCCCEIKHLFLGTNYENIIDKMHKDRSGKKLCIEKVKEIKEIFKNGFSQSEIAYRFGVNQSQISRILSGKRWIHVQ